MPLMCPLEGCKSTPGMCKHDKAMLIMAAVVALALVGWMLV